LIIAQNDLETLITYLANDKALKMAEARAETDRLVQVLSGNLGANGVLADGRTINFSVSDWETLLKGETVTQGGNNGIVTLSLPTRSGNVALTPKNIRPVLR
jgi:hypothetical protein